MTDDNETKPLPEQPPRDIPAHSSIAETAIEALVRQHDEQIKLLHSRLDTFMTPQEINDKIGAVDAQLNRAEKLANDIVTIFSSATFSAEKQVSQEKRLSDILSWQSHHDVMHKGSDHKIDLMAKALIALVGRDVTDPNSKPLSKSYLERIEEMAATAHTRAQAVADEISETRADNIQDIAERRAAHLVAMNEIKDKMEALDATSAKIDRVILFINRAQSVLDLGERILKDRRLTMASLSALVVIGAAVFRLVGWILLGA